MSNISRRDFMKTAGVMTLAVAASGVLAGCSTAAEEEVVKTSATSATVGDYTVSIADTKLVASKSYDGDGKATTTQLLFVMMNIKANKEDAKDKELKYSFKTTGLKAATNAEDYDNAKILKNVFGNEDLNVVDMPSSGSKLKATVNDTYGDGSFAMVAYKVKQNSDDSFVTPTFKVKVDTGDEYVTLDATIPSATDIVASKIK